MPWYVITGGPCSGKTTLISKLSEIGYRTVSEAARALIDKNVSEGKTLEEMRLDEEDFQAKVLEFKIKVESELPKDEIVFLDRGVPDTIAYCQLYGFDVQKVLKKCSGKTYKKVFFLDQLPFKKDYARIEDVEKVKILNELLKKAYLDLGYEVMIVPVMPIEERLNFILSSL